MASKGVNKVTIIGRIGKDPEVRYNQQGGAIANVSVATSESWKDKQTGEQKEKTEWHRVVVFGKLAEIVGQYLKKGSQVYFEGKLQTRKWQDQSGQDRYSTEVVVDQVGGVMQMLGGRDQGSQQSQGDWDNQGQQQPATQQGFPQNQPPQPAPPQQPGFAPQQPARQAPQQGGFNQQAPVDFTGDVPF